MSEFNGDTFSVCTGSEAKAGGGRLIHVIPWKAGVYNGMMRCPTPAMMYVPYTMTFSGNNVVLNSLLMVRMDREHTARQLQTSKTLPQFAVNLHAAFRHTRDRPFCHTSIDDVNGLTSV